MKKMKSLKLVIFFANLKLSGQDNLYYFDNKGSEGHYDKNGKSVKKH